MLLKPFVTGFTPLGLSLVLALGVAVATSDTVSAASSEENVAQRCKILLQDPENAGITQGGCVAFFKAGHNTPLLAGICRLEEAVAFAETVSGRENLNHGQCVVVLKELGTEQ
ncbi:MAG TPA: hypothetical protein VGW38_02750 [Chloroflexota bacterium]|nr:hypothetical protein [Chloroflexota bacterium]